LNDTEKSQPLLPRPSKSLDTGKMPEQTGQEAQIKYKPSPAAPSFNREIHPRQPVPPVPEGESVPDKCPSPPVELD